MRQALKGAVFLWCLVFGSMAIVGGAVFTGGLLLDGEWLFGLLTAGGTFLVTMLAMAGVDWGLRF